MSSCEHNYLAIASRDVGEVRGWCDLLIGCGKRSRSRLGVTMADFDLTCMEQLLPSTLVSYIDLKALRCHYTRFLPKTPIREHPDQDGSVTANVPNA